jgi:hypothetical protein
VIRKILQIPAAEVLPSRGAVMGGQGIPRWTTPNGKISQLADDALSLYGEKARPAGILMEIPRDEFGTVFQGRGSNEEESPVGPIYRASDRLALFAVTVGEAVCAEISRLFRHNDFALGSMLDSAASEGTEMAARAVEDFYRTHLRDTGMLDSLGGTLCFSPGYCGWHISAQEALFNALRPGEIGIALNESFLMQPLKSISGVIVAGRKEIFDFEDTFSFCRDCRTHSCRDRISSLLEQ